MLISEKTAPLFNRPSATVRQVDEGGIQIGASSEDVGLDDRENIPVTAGLARDAIALYPVLQNIKLVRSWTALRIMSPDGLPIYQKSLTQYADGRYDVVEFELLGLQEIYPENHRSC